MHLTGQMDQAFLPLLDKKQGRIVQVSSGIASGCASVVPTPFQGPYAQKLIVVKLFLFYIQIPGLKAQV